MHLRLRELQQSISNLLNGMGIVNTQHKLKETDQQELEGMLSQLPATKNGDTTKREVEFLEYLTKLLREHHDIGPYWDRYKTYYDQRHAGFPH